MLETVNKETVEYVSLIVEGLGFSNVSFHEINRNTF